MYAVSTVELDIHVRSKDR